MMDSWVDTHDPMADDLGAYMAAKGDRRRVRAERGVFAAPSKLYGYQEPKSVAKARPRMVPAVDNGGWDSSKGSGIPKLSADSKATQRAAARQPRRLPVAAPARGADRVCFAAPRGAQTADAARSTKLPPLKQAARAYSNPVPIRRNQTLPPIGTKRVASPARSPRKVAQTCDGGEQPSSVCADVPAPSERKRDVLAEEAQNLVRAQQQLAQERELRSHHSTRSAHVTADVEDATVELSRLKSEIKCADRRVRDSTAAEAERQRLQAQLRKRDNQFRDLKRMQCATSKRLDELRMEIAVKCSSPRSIEQPAELRKNQLRDAARSQDAAARHVAALREERTRLNDLLALAAADATDAKRRQALVHDRIERERRAACDALYDKYEHDLERELARLKDNHHKASRHRVREFEMKRAEERHLRDVAARRLDNAAAIGGTALRDASELRVASSTQSGIADEICSQLQKAVRTCSEATKTSSERQLELQRLVADVADLERQAAVAAAPQHAPHPRSGEWQTDRKTLQGEADAQKRLEQQHLKRLADLDAEQGGLATLEDKRAAEAGVGDAEIVHGQAKQDAVLASERMSKLAKERRAAEKALDTTAKDAVIESNTRKLSVAQAAHRDASRENAMLLERLDQAERLISLSNLT